MEPGNSVFEVVPGTVQTFRDHVTVELLNRENRHPFILKLESVQGNTFHLEIDEKAPLKPRYRVVDALKGPVQTVAVQVEKGADETTVTSQNKKAVIVHKPFRLDFYLDDVLTVSVNSKGLMRFEHLRKKTEPKHEDAEHGGAEAPDAAPQAIEDADPGAWEENFKSHHDSKKDGPEAIALDFSFPRADLLFGIPEHADSFALKSTLDGEPYRLYNLDVFEYELNNGMALYGEKLSATFATCFFFSRSPRSIANNQRVVDSFFHTLFTLPLQAACPCCTATAPTRRRASTGKTRPRPGWTFTTRPRLRTTSSGRSSSSSRAAAARPPIRWPRTL